ncbi:hypothetical protein BH11MYX1_BH11MYX1_25680 [soil metagenome]
MTFCCVRCRLLQPPTTVCADCGAPMTAPVELVRELLYYRDMRLVRLDWGLITAFLAGSSLAVPILTPVAALSAIALGYRKLAQRWRSPIAAVELPPITATPGAMTIYGTARKLRSTITSLVDDREVLIEHATLRERRGPNVLLRRTECAPFLLDLVDGSGQVVIAGATRMRAPTLMSHHAWVKRGDPLLEKMGVPSDFGIAGALEVHTVREGGPVLALTGIVEDEAVAELAFHRDGGLVRVMRGRSGSPIIVEDRRLIGALPVRY